METPSAPGDTPAVSPTAPAPTEPQTAPAASAQPAPTGSEPDNNSGGQPAMVPSDRLREETQKRREAEEALEEYRNAHPDQPPAPNEDDNLDPETEAIIRKGAKKLGLVSQEELVARDLQIQVKQDVKDLETSYANSGVPYVHQDVVRYAKENNMPITSKAALRAIYRDMNADKIVEIEKQRWIDQVKGNPSAAAETPGSSAQAPSTPSEVKGSSPKERTLSRIQRARQKVAQGI